MQSSTPSQQTFGNKSQDSSSVSSEENGLPLEVHDDHDNDRGLKLESLSLQANSTPGVPTEEVVAVDSINRLPVEMLSEIFLACAHTLDKSELHKMDSWGIPHHHYGLMLARNAVPYIVSSVCKRWRSIGLSTPKLWSQFTVSCSGRELEKFMVALRTWLKRSKNYPLEFTCLSGDKDEEEVLAELFKNIHRWHIVYFGNSEASYLVQQWFRNDGLKAENLDTLEFSRCNGSLNIAFERFPNLRRLKIHPHCLVAEEVRGLSLTHLTLTNLEGNTATFFSHLRQFPSLISFEAPVDGLKDDDDLGYPPLTTFTHTTLTELTITRCYGSYSLRDILANIHLPSIRCLHLKGYPRGQMHDIVNDFIRRHESTFTDLVLSGLETTGEEMIETFRMFPKHLTSYRSLLHGLPDECVKRLTLDPSDPSQDLALNLSSISLYVYDVFPSVDLLAEMILSRWARNPHTTFNFRMPDTVPNPLSDPRIARHVKYNPGLLEFIVRLLRY